MKTPKTVDEILEFVRENSKPGDWKLGDDGLIRSDNGFCPLCWVGRRVGVNNELFLDFDTTIGRRLGLTLTDVEAMRRAVDNSTGHDKNLRQRLLKACHLEGKR